ncbi:MAG TPA: phosphatidylserine decarboxylase [Candidatus Nanoarchaeia archaeon]|nr:phosphatidylserine decarboxylase [Candidatus Nanoarchaeia archaeon]
MLLEIIISVLALLIASFLLNFYRDPKRTIPTGNNIVSPADGRVISIIDTTVREITVSKGMIGKIRTMTKDISKECYVVSIFMSPLDAHINRAPIEGTIKSIRHANGKFFKAYDLEKSFENEKNEIIIENKNMKIKVIQIAGFLARRILCYAKVEDKVNKGQKIGMIALGSQATIIMPKSVKLKIKINDKVKAGESIIADLK